MRAVLLILLVAVAAWAAREGFFYTTGSQFYEGCWQRQVEEKKAALGDAQARGPKEAALWASCTPLVAQAMDDVGFVLGSSAENAPADAKALAADCPDRYKDLPVFMDRLYTRVVEIIEKTGGPALIDQFTPADWLIKRAVNQRWPNCTKAARPYLEKARKNGS
jgi:hypothetical protein